MTIQLITQTIHLSFPQRPLAQKSIKRKIKSPTAVRGNPKINKKIVSVKRRSVLNGEAGKARRGRKEGKATTKKTAKVGKKVAKRKVGVQKKSGPTKGKERTVSAQPKGGAGVKRNGNNNKNNKRMHHRLKVPPSHRRRQKSSEVSKKLKKKLELRRLSFEEGQEDADDESEANTGRVKVAKTVAKGRNKKQKSPQKKAGAGPVAAKRKRRPKNAAGRKRMAVAPDRKPKRVAANKATDRIRKNSKEENEDAGN